MIPEMMPKKDKPVSGYTWTWLELILLVACAGLASFIAYNALESIFMIAGAYGR